MRFTSTLAVQERYRPRRLSGAALLMLLSSAYAGAGTTAVDLAAQPLVGIRYARPAHTLDLSAAQATTRWADSQKGSVDALRPLAWTGARGESLGRPAHALPEPEANVRSSGSTAFTVRWQRSPEFVRVARNFRRNGLPVVRLWQSGRNLVAIGVSPRGVPGIYFTQKIGD